MYRGTTQKKDIIYKALTELIPYDKNAKKHDETQINNVAESIKQFGFVQPIVVDKNNVIVIGHCRALAACCIEQLRTQANKGGLTDAYLHDGTWVKSFFSVMSAPSCVKVSAMGNVDYRYHHLVNWNNCTPMILNERYKKG